MAFTSIRRPESVGEALAPLLRLRTEQVDDLANAISGPRSFSVSANDIAELKNSLGLTEDDLSFALAYLSLLYDHLSEMKQSGMSFIDGVESIVNDLKLGEVDAALVENSRAILSRLLAENDTHKRYRKIERLRSGFIPNVTNFSNFVDLRPVYDGSDDDLKVTSYLALVQLKISTDSLDEDKRNIVVQLTPDSIIQLRKSLDRADRKISALRNQLGLASMLIEF